MHIHGMQNLVQRNAEQTPLHSYDELILLGKDLRKKKVVFLFLNYAHRETIVVLYHIHTTSHIKTIYSFISSKIQAFLFTELLQFTFSIDFQAFISKESFKILKCFWIAKFVNTRTDIKEIIIATHLQYHQDLIGWISTVCYFTSSRTAIHILFNSECILSCSVSTLYLFQQQGRKAAEENGYFKFIAQLKMVSFLKTHSEHWKDNNIFHLSFLFLFMKNWNSDSLVDRRLVSKGNLK